MSVFGIDLGTTFTSCSFVPEGGEPSLVCVDPFQGQSMQLASAILLRSDATGGRIAEVGASAVQKILQGDSGRVIEFAKQYLGEEGISSRVWEFDGVAWDATDASSLILSKVAKTLREVGGHTSIRAVVTHPRDYMAARKDCVRQAAELAGIELIDMIDEPVAAAYAFFRPEEFRDPGVYVVFDLGGGTLDIAVLECGEDGSLRVLEGAGERSLGGRHWDEAMYELMLEAGDRATAAQGYEFRSEIDGASHARLRKLSADWKLRAANRPTLQAPVLVSLRPENEGAAAVPVRVPLSVSTAEWKKRCTPLVEQCEAALTRALNAANIKDEDVLQLLPVGGSVRLSSIQELLNRRFPQRVFAIDTHGGIKPDLAVALGAGYYAQYAASTSPQAGASNSVLVPVTQPITTALAHGINVLTENDQLTPLVKRGTELPVSERLPLEVSEVGSRLQLELFEGPPGDRNERKASGTVSFPKSLALQVGDEVELCVHVSQSGAIAVDAKHVRTQESVKATLQFGSAEGAGKASGSDVNGPAGRAARLATIRVL